MSAKSREPRRQGGRPKGSTGTQKTGGRKRGTPNKTRSIRLREAFREAGFNYVEETIATLRNFQPGEYAQKMETLVKMAPYFMQRLRPEPEILEGESTVDIPDEQTISTEDLLKLVKS